MGRNNSRIRGTKKNRTRKKKGGNSYEKDKLCKICFKNTALDRYCANGHYFCSVCIESWGRARGCPGCRGKYEPEEPIDINNTGYGQYRYSMGFVDAPVSIGLVKNYKYGDCCTPCEKGWCGTVMCGKPSCRACKKNSAKKIIGIYDEDLYCKKEGYEEGNYGNKKSNGGGKKKRRRRRTKKKRKKRNSKKRTRRRRKRR